ncbi:12-(S)-hydroxy-5,8,10,14-eicosatetraenoic acid receptor [Protopterus annectens]|uniref:12-(S)-hydroxy-5,8,10,14-eicosatetraenoic acid receptor n=1 Tax=Protopterus annectens TaxID=7888 RepID=UPI001CFA582D|nr:12-(S)-hydroxy-5,8,10,14-eicosatetraenoic acid receptor [Protopterus annectens]
MLRHNCSLNNAPVKPVILGLLILETILGLAGNFFALWIFTYRLKTWKPCTIYLFNLSVADFFLNICLPFRIHFFLTEKWIFKDPFCRINLFLLNLNRAGSVAFLTAVTLDRYLRVIHPHRRFSLLSTKSAKKVVCFTWLLVLSVTIHILTEQKIGVTECKTFNTNGSATSSVWQESIFFVELLFPFFINVFCTVCIIKKLRDLNMDKQHRVRKAVHLVVSVVVVYAVCFLPSILSRIALLVLEKSENCKGLQTAVNAFDVSLTITYLNSAMDPIVYCFTSPTFRAAYREALNSIKLRFIKEETQGSETSKDSDS